MQHLYQGCHIRSGQRPVKSNVNGFNVLCRTIPVLPQMQTPQTLAARTPPAGVCTCGA